MPYKANINLPNDIKNVLPYAAQTVWRKAFNNAWMRYHQKDDVAAKVAWSALKQSGYKKSQTTNRWVR